MANHRADRRSLEQRPPSDLATPIATSTDLSVPGSVTGKRRAEKRGRRDRRPSTPAPLVLREDEETLVIPVTASALAAATYQTSRVTGVRATTTRRSGPSQPGARRSASRAPLFRGLPSPRSCSGSRL